MSFYRLFVEKLEDYRIESLDLMKEFNTNLNLTLKNLRVINVYDLKGFDQDLINLTKYSVFGEIVTDNVFDKIDLKNNKYLAVEY
ncbi:MAG: AIR synthase-related protein, partial [Anaeroplasmataceae bacterium]